MTVEQKVALVTGASRGIGAAIADGLGRSGITVVGTATTEAGADKISQRFADNNISGRGMVLNVAEANSVDSVLKAMAEEFGAPTILVNNAGIIRREDSLDYTAADWDAVMDVNLKALFFTTQAFAKAHLDPAPRGPAAVVNIASLLAFQGGIRVPAYTASKHGVAGLTKILANEWAADGINVNAIAPGYVVSNNTENLRKDADRNAAILARIPAGRWGEPSDIGHTAAFLASPAAAYIHGAVINVDGGWLAR